ncbi:3-mercaptopyruvate sulfurtransferase [Arthrobacter sp. TPD3018]|uniref:3-mercaptopyruvate sulfurtransferase n=1 Tax=Bacteria TaxID=2 RepID=UPI000D51A23C|nr:MULTISPECIES: 3-mercaptopyruvate sulfurtransferase [Bacteria]PVE55879.1 3-mercaptopyruvate sulfurtransferase [Sphingomonas sp. TPD3009]PVE57620.1 3-mercaptopyruvate sulfurtransferase [Arthrobacter sp. TPD3018]PVE83245.1 3-mercaptopyruvate sulfurtransferase [Sphingomonas melonis]
MDALVTTEWLAAEMGASDLRIVDATYFANFPGETPRDAAAEYEAAHIPGAVFMNLGELRDTDSDLPMMLPSAEKFASRMQSLGLGDGSRVVLYDNSPHHTAARAWWMLRTFGAHDVAILDGGLAKWQAEGRETASGKEALRHRHFTVWADQKNVRTLDQMKANVDSGAEQVVDARSAARFTGEEPDPRPATHAGHIPGSKNLPQGQLFNADGTWKTGDALREAFASAGVDLDKPMVATCGSGITAAVLAFGAHLVGKAMPIYDGSWSEWGADRSTPKAMGAKEAVDA